MWSPASARMLSGILLPMNREAVIILGMHRRGTSALGGVLELLGVDFGTHLAPPSEHNEKGYWEHLDIVAAAQITSP